MKTIICITMFCVATCFAQAPETPKGAGQTQPTSSAGTATFGQQAPMKNIMAQMESKSGSKVTGFVVFQKVGDQVLAAGAFQNLKPGKHGVHIHENGDCSAPDAASAGAHFNPTHQHHGGPSTEEHHAGDLGNIDADASGNARLNWTGKLSLEGADSIIGKSLVVHEKEDDLKTDPAGNSGTRIACGVIKEQ
jgi:Cu-Zn family superoxide dismutase